MKFLLGILAATTMGGNAPTVINPGTIGNNIKYWDNKIEHSTDVNVDVINKNYTKADIKKPNDFLSDMQFDAPNATEVLLNQDQMDFYHDIRISYLNIYFTYEIEISCKDGHNKEIFKAHYPRDMSGDVNTYFHVQEVNRSMHIEYKDANGSFKVNANKRGTDSLSVKPSIILSKHKDTDKDHYMKVRLINISFNGYANVYNLDNIKMKKIVHEYGNKNSNKEVEEWFFGHTDIDSFLIREYDLPLDFIDKKLTWKNTKYDSLNFDREVKISFNIVPNKKYITVGNLRQDVYFKFSRKISDGPDIKSLYSSTLYKTLHDVHLNPEEINLVIDLKMKLVLLGGVWPYEFVNDGEIKNWDKFRSLTIMNGKYFIAKVSNGKWDIRDYKTLGNLFNIDSVEIKENDKKVPDKPEEIVNETKEEKPEKQAENNKEIKEEKKKSSPLKYLWLLTIPITLGIAGLISWFIPFRKMKKRHNDIK